MSNKKTPRKGKGKLLPAKPLPRAEFNRELIKVVNGDPTADPHIRAFFNDMQKTFGFKAALIQAGGVELLYDTPRRSTTTTPEEN